MTAATGTAAPATSAMTETAWMTSAACATRSDLPWTTDTTRLPRRAVAAMGRVCRACPVREACAAHADATTATGGFWAGTDRAVEQLPLFPDLTPGTGPGVTSARSSLRESA